MNADFDRENDPYQASQSGEVGPTATSGKAVASFVLGLTSLICTFFTGIPAIILGSISLGEISNSRGRLGGRGLAISGIVIGSIGSMLVGLAFLMALLLPAVQAAREAARRNASMNNMKQMGLAMHNYYGDKKQLPAAYTVDENGRPLLSWRVSVLPYLEETSLADKFHKDEAWDSPHNSKLASTAPSEFVSPVHIQEGNAESNIFVVVGDDTMFPGEKPVGFRDVRDGPAKTIMAVELQGAGITWSEPRDITIDDLIAAAGRSPHDSGLRPLYRGGIVCLFCDSSVRMLPEETRPEEIRALCTRSGGEPFNLFSD